MNTLKDILILAMGAGAGALLGYYINESRHKGEILTDYKEMEAYYKNKYANAENDEETTESDMKTEESKEPIDISQARKTTEKPPITDYTKNYRSNDDRKIKIDDDYMQKHWACADLKRPYAISEDEFEDIEYNKVYLNVYTCGTVTDDAGIVIDNVEDSIGLDFLNQFMASDKDEIYVRNPRIRLDYELTKIDEEF